VVVGSAVDWVAVDWGAAMVVAGWVEVAKEAEDWAVAGSGAVMVAVDWVAVGWAAAWVEAGWVEVEMVAEGSAALAAAASTSTEARSKSSPVAQCLQKVLCSK
jgi:hypothetical protein